MAGSRAGSKVFALGGLPLRRTTPEAPRHLSALWPQIGPPGLLAWKPIGIAWDDLSDAHHSAPCAIAVLKTIASWSGRQKSRSGARQSFPGPLSWDCACGSSRSARRGEHGDVSWRYMGPGGPIWRAPAGRFRGVWVAREL